MTRALIVNADDFGRSDGINRGVIAAFEEGIVTSASLMVRWPAARAAAAAANERRALALGLHVDLAESAYERDGWKPVYSRVPAADAKAVASELDAQLDAFRALVRRDPAHLDSHQHVHREEPLRSLLLERGARLGIPVRGEGRVRYSGAFYGQLRTGEPHRRAISVEGLLETLGNLGDGVTELVCHPAAGLDFESMYGAERLQELRTLCDPTVKARIDELGIELWSFADLGSATGSAAR